MQLYLVLLHVPNEEAVLSLGPRDLRLRFSLALLLFPRGDLEVLGKDDLAEGPPKPGIALPLGIARGAVQLQRVM